MNKQIFKRHKSLFGLGLGILIFALIPAITRSPYYLNLLITTLVYSVLAMAFVMVLRTGLINMGIAAFWGVGSYISVILVRNMHFSFWAALPLSGLATALVALGIGYFLIASKSTSFGFVMLTSVIGMIFTVTVGNIDYLGGYTGFNDVPGVSPIHFPLLGTITFNSSIQLYYLAIFIVAVIIIILGSFYSRWTNRAWIAIGLAPRLAESIGVNLFSYKLLAFVISSGVVGIIGSYYVHYSQYITPNTYNMWINVYVQMYAILGGIGYAILGPIIGSAIATLVPELVRATQNYAPIFIGLILILLIMFLPGGLLSLIKYRTAFGRIKKNISWIRKNFGFQ